MRPTRSLVLAATLASSLVLGACASDDPGTVADRDEEPPTTAEEGSDGPLVMEPQDVDDESPADPGAPPSPHGDPPPPPGLDPDAAPQSPDAFARAQQAQQQWQDLGVTSYDMVIERICFCPSSGELRVTVEDGVVTDAAFVDPTRADEPLQPEWAPTLDQLLDNALSVARGFEDVALEIEVEEGVPVRGSADAPMVADEEVTWTVMEFTPR